MARSELIMPKLGESIMEATILRWSKKVGDKVELDETVLEIATDKVDTEVPSPFEGILTEILFEEGAVVPIGACIARLDSDVAAAASPAVAEKVVNSTQPLEKTIATEPATLPVVENNAQNQEAETPSSSDRYYSPLVKNIAKTEGISLNTLDAVAGTGKDGRLTKEDLMQYIESKKLNPSTNAPQPPTVQKETVVAQVVATQEIKAPAVDRSGNVDIIEMDRMRKLIADHMVMSKRVSPHVTSFIEVDVTNLVNWRNKNKKTFQERYNENITFTPIFIEAVAKVIKDLPMINVSVEGNQIIKKNFINIGMAAALPSGNLIVPVIKNADMLNLAGLTKSVNDLANRARANQLKPDEIQGGTFTVTNVGTFGNVMGTPIINQPQVAILALGAIRKKPAVLETEFGDVIAIRQMMFMSLSYDHRVVDGSLGGSFLKKMADYLEDFDTNRDF
jgi:2-oxoglutarate dehydrogenase E2 component (dihydrolipoamide succinyltransferase)